MGSSFQPHGDSARPRESTQQTGCIVADLDRDGVNGFVLSLPPEGAGPGLVSADERRRVGPICDRQRFSDRRGRRRRPRHRRRRPPDLVFGADWQGDEVWWWENPGPAITIPTSLLEAAHHQEGWRDTSTTTRSLATSKERASRNWFSGTKVRRSSSSPTSPTIRGTSGRWPLAEVFSGNAGEEPGQVRRGSRRRRHRWRRQDRSPGRQLLVQAPRQATLHSPSASATIGGRIAAGQVSAGIQVPAGRDRLRRRRRSAQVV